MALDPVSAALNIGSQLIERLWPDPEQRDKARLALLDLEQSGELAEMTAKSAIITAEASSEHWLTATWRPIVMLFFAGLVGAHWLGFTPERISDEVVVHLLDIVQVGIGGYVIGRSAEKAVKLWKAK